MDHHISPARTVIFAVLSGMFLGIVGSHAGSLHFCSLVWGLFYGIGFEPAAIYYKLHGPYPFGFLDLFGEFAWPLIASIGLYFVVRRLSRISNPAIRRKVKIGLTLSFFVMVPHHNLTPDELAYFPVWSQGLFLTMSD